MSTRPDIAMHTGGAVVRPAPSLYPLVGRWSAAIGTISAVGHLVVLTTHGAGHPLLITVLMAAMAAACLVCTWHLWRGPSKKVWIASAVMYAGMCVLHLPLATDMAGHNSSETHAAAHHSGHHEVMGAATGLQHATPMAVLSVLAAVQVVLAVAVLVRARR